MLNQRRVFRALNEPFTVMGYNVVELLVAYFAFYYGMALKGPIVGGAALAICFGVLKYAKSKDPRYLNIVLRAKRFRASFDAAGRSTPPWTP